MRADEVMETDFILLWADMDLNQALHLLNVHEADYVIIKRWEEGDYTYYYLIPTSEVRARLEVWSGPITVKEVLDLHEGDAASHVDATTDASDAPDRAVVVRDGRPVGYRDVQPAAAPDPLMGLDDPGDLDFGVPANGGGTLPPAHPGTIQPPRDLPADEEPETGRHLRVEVENHDQALEPDQFYSLALDIGRATSASVELMPGGDEADLFDEDAESVDLGVVFFSTDFTLGTTGKQVLILPRR
ncbi:MAG: TCAD7 domain-containing protein, partial [Candidatus Promineifilaceae bacterium]|nr:TCAD7 domain-containing protein [Candidatus Promineifilaceae bacterium]